MGNHVETGSRDWRSWTFVLWIILAVRPGVAASIDLSGTSLNEPPAALTSSTLAVGSEASISGTTLHEGAASLSSTVMAAARPVSSTVVNSDISVSGIQVRQVTIKGSQAATLTLPDGNGRVVIENRLGRSLVRIGGHYNFYNGLIETWVTYGHQLWKTGPLLQISASDHIGLGQLYFKQRSLERTRELPVAIGQQFPFGSMSLSVSRASWLLAPLDAPAMAEKGLIDSIGYRFTATDVIPDIAEHLDALRPDTTVLEYRRAFRNFSGDYGFERFSADVFDYFPGVRHPDEAMVRVYAGHAFSITSSVTASHPSSATLPIRETFGLGGASTLRGYQPGEFRGRGIMGAEAEYALVTPWSFSIRLIRLSVWQTAALFFVEEGRIQDSWRRPNLLHGQATKWSAGMGMRFKGKWLNSHRSIVRFYAAQAGDYPARQPVFYALIDVGD